MKTYRRDPSDLANRLSLWAATGFGIGLVTPAPGTVGGLLGIPLSWAIMQSPGLAWQLAATLGVGLLAVNICSRAVKMIGGNDPQEIVLDEIAALPLVYLGSGLGNWRVMWAGWLLFRLFDITKPPPVRNLEKLSSGWGVVADDAAAACYACCVLWALKSLDQTFAWGLLTPIPLS